MVKKEKNEITGKKHRYIAGDYFMTAGKISGAYKLTFWGNHNCPRVVLSPDHRIAAFTHRAERDTNQDGLLVHVSKERKVFAVADGLGGRHGGDVASRLALETLAEGVPQMISLDTLIKRANQRIIDRCRSDSTLREMGTTLTAAEVVDDYVYISHVGDSRTYLIRQSNIGLMTFDQTHGSRKFGVIPEFPMLYEFPIRDIGKYYEYIRKLPARKKKLNSILGRADMRIFNSFSRIYPGDRLLLATDGLSELPYGDFAEILEGMDDIETTADKLQSKRPLFGDDVTFVLSEHF
jgi:serine/threonine protein phosphatase PrpC